MSAANDASIVAVMGSSGSGKSLYIKQFLQRKKPVRLIVWDAQAEYSGFGKVVNTVQAAFDLMVAAGRGGSFNIVFVPGNGAKIAQLQFDAICQIVYAAGYMTFVVEELAFVTSPSYAPPGWAAVTLKGRHRGLRVIGASQRPASIDKHFFGNATTIRTGRLNFESDLATLSNVLQVPRDEILNLQPLQFVERDMHTGKVSRGRLKV